MMKTALLLLFVACAAHAQTSNPDSFAAMPVATWRHVYQQGQNVICEAVVGGATGHGLAIGNATLQGSEIRWNGNGAVLVRFVGAPSSSVSYSYAGGVCVITYQ